VLITAVDTFADELSVRNDPITYRADPAFARPQLVAVHILVGIDGVVGGLLLFGCSPVPDQPRSGQSGIVRHLAIVAQGQTDRSVALGTGRPQWIGDIQAQRFAPSVTERDLINRSP
jgi:hypothetical protein